MFQGLIQGFVELDPALQNWISIGVTALVSFLILQLVAYVPWLAEYLGQYKNGIVVWLTGIVIQLINAGLAQIPATWDEVLRIAMQLIAAVIAALVAFFLWKRAKLRGSAALM
jgi:hypothetical protein